jgi:hypothetical protein
VWPAVERRIKVSFKICACVNFEFWQKQTLKETLTACSACMMRDATTLHTPVQVAQHARCMVRPHYNRGDDPVSCMAQSGCSSACSSFV